MSTRRRACVAVAMMMPCLAACGGSQPSSPGATPPSTSLPDSATQAPPSAGPATTGAGTATATSRHQRLTEAARESGAITRSSGPAKAQNRAEPSADDQNAAATANVQDPCGLVTRAEARLILGPGVAPPVSAEQGPTCIYRPARAKTFVTVAVQTVNLAAIRRDAKPLARVPIKGRQGYCVRYGSPMMYVPLANGRVLHITASCRIAASFAAKALPRISG